METSRLVRSLIPRAELSPLVGLNPTERFQGFYRGALVFLGVGTWVATGFHSPLWDVLEFMTLALVVLSVDQLYNKFVRKYSDRRAVFETFLYLPFVAILSGILILSSFLVRSWAAIGMLHLAMMIPFVWVGYRIGKNGWLWALILSCSYDLVLSIYQGVSMQPSFPTLAFVGGVIGQWVYRRTIPVTVQSLNT